MRGESQLNFPEHLGEVKGKEVTTVCWGIESKEAAVTKASRVLKLSLLWRTAA